MKSLNRNISVILVVMFILVTSYAAIELISLPDDIMRAVDISENSKLVKARNIAYQSYIALGVDLFLVLLLIFFFSTSNFNSKVENVVYVEKEHSEKDLKEGEQQVDGAQNERRLQKTKEILQYNQDVNSVPLNQIISAICTEIQAVAGAIYTTEYADKTRQLVFKAGYAFQLPDSRELKYEFGEGIAGQVAKSGQEVIISSIPDGYIQIFSGLGKSCKAHLVVIPIKLEESVIGVIEVASFNELPQEDLEYIRKISSLLTFELKDEFLSSSEAFEENKEKNSSE